ncbi:MAG: hypothetical protein ACKVOR_10690 [Flavobacteriales bacterium]
MKALAMTLAIALFTLTAAASNGNTNGINKDKLTRFKEAVTKQVNKHLFFLAEGGKDIAGEADVMLSVLPEGDVHVIFILTKNPLIKKFVEKQVSKMKIAKDQVVAGQILNYRFVFKAHN